ncbi:MAG: membrane dipeptidase, partial [Pyrinomonadaceae bacterium]
SSLSSQSPSQHDERLWKRALAIHRKAIVVDGHNDITSPMTDERYDLAIPSAGKYHTDIARLKEGGVTGQFFAIYVDKKYVKEGGSMRRAMDMIDDVYRAAERHPNDLVFTTTAEGIIKAKKQGNIAALMGIEGGHAIDDSLSALRDFYRLGVRYMTLTHTNNNNWAGSSGEPDNKGLTDFGKEVVREMNHIGMLVDISHVSDQTMNDVLDTVTAPVIASHSSARALCNHPRDIPDDLLKRIGKNGGVVMVNFYPTFIDQKVYDAAKERETRLKPQTDALTENYKNDPKRLADELTKLNNANPLPTTSISKVIDHIDYIAKLIGVDHVGLGSDFDGIPSVPVGLEDVSKFPEITYGLLQRGYAEKDIQKILGGNLVRVLGEAERVARKSGKTISGDGSDRRITGKD